MATPEEKKREEQARGLIVRRPPRTSALAWPIWATTGPLVRPPCRPAPNRVCTSCDAVWPCRVLGERRQKIGWLMIRDHRRPVRIVCVRVSVCEPSSVSPGSPCCYWSRRGPSNRCGAGTRVAVLLGSNLIVSCWLAAGCGNFHDCFSRTPYFRSSSASSPSFGRPFPGWRKD